MKAHHTKSSCDAPFDWLYRKQYKFEKQSVGNGLDRSESIQIFPIKLKYGKHPERSRPFPTMWLIVCG